MPTEPSAQIILDSISPAGSRLTTFQCTGHRFILAEFNTHRWSRNSASSRAIPVAKRIDQVLNDTAFPVHWGANQRGMQAAGELEPWQITQCRDIWLDAAEYTATAARKLSEIGLHKQVTNRLLEPFLWHTIVFSTTEAQLNNFFQQRCHKDAQPEMQMLARAIQKAYTNSVPTILGYDYGSISGWHLPYILPNEETTFSLPALRAISVARCARVSYRTFDGKVDPVEDLKLYNKLLAGVPPHDSPFEHVARPVPISDHCPGNFVGWLQLRHCLDLKKEVRLELCQEPT